MHENYVYDLWPPWLDLTLHLHEMPGCTDRATQNTSASHKVT